MFKLKKLAENILEDLMDNAPISDILLKVKIFASQKGDQELLSWASKELGGYEDTPPSYRIITCGVKVEVFVPFRGTNLIEFPPELIKDEKIRNRLSKLPFHNSVTELEELSKTSDDNSLTLQTRLPIGIYSYITPFINGHIQDAYQYVTKATAKQVVVTVKSLLIDYLLKISNEENIDFNTFIKINNMVANNITAGIVNIGSGTVNAQGSVNTVGEDICISLDNKQNLLKIIEQLDSISAQLVDKEEYNSITNDIKEEIEKPQPSKTFLKRCFQAIPMLFASVSSDIIANEVTPLIQNALSFLGC